MVALPNSPQTIPLEQKVKQLEATNQNLQQLLQKARQEKYDIEQKYRRIRDIVYNTKLERQERIDTIALIDAEENGRYKDKQGYTRINMGKVAERIGTDEKTLKKTRDMHVQTGFMNCIEAKIPENGDERNRIYIACDEEKKQNPLLIDRFEPRKVKEARKKYTYRCQKCLEIGTVETSRHLVCTNPDCEACGTKVLIDVSYDEQLEARKEEMGGDTENFSPTPDDRQESDHTENFSPLLDLSIRPETFRYPHEDESNKHPTYRLLLMTRLRTGYRNG